MNILKHISSWIKENWIYIVIFCLLFSLRVCAINNKTVFFFDDPASFNVSTPNNLFEDGSKIKYDWADLRFYYHQNYTVLSLKKVLFESKADIKSIISDLVFLHNNTLDRQHPNLYYSILRIWTAGMDYSDINAMKWRGCSLNLVFFTIAFLFMLKFLNEIKPDKKFIALGLFFAFITTGTISNTLLIRAYPMMEASFILILYIFLVLYKSIDKKTEISRKQLVLYSIGLSIFLLSEYYALIFSAIIFLVLTYKCFREQYLKFLIRILAIYVSAFIIVLLFCPIYFENFETIEHLNETQKASNIWNFIDFYRYGMYVLENLSKYVYNNMTFYILLLGLFAIGVPIFNNDKFNHKETKHFFMIFAIVALYAYLICSIAPFHEDVAVRYIIITFSVFGLLIAYFVYHLKMPLAIITIIFMFLSSFFPVCYDINMQNSKYKCLGMMSYFRNLNKLDLSKYEYNEQTKSLRPVVLANRNWIWPNYIMYLRNDNIVRFEDYNPSKYEGYVFNDYVLVDIEYVNIVENGRKKW